MGVVKCQMSYHPLVSKVHRDVVFEVRDIRAHLEYGSLDPRCKSRYAAIISTILSNIQRRT